MRLTASLLYSSIFTDLGLLRPVSIMIFYSNCNLSLNTASLLYLTELFAVTPEIGQQTVPVFMELNYKQSQNRSGNDIPNIRRTATPSSPSQHYLQLPGQQVTQMGCPSPNISTRMFGDADDSEDLSHLHLIGRVCLDHLASDLMNKVKALLQVSI